ncbi:MAG: NAD(P)H-hydrate dehydratase [Propionibacteriaceae bacterium]|jgi:hydroxyethylthiazole kinase-like uncharacterized protein yjeF|nr:NAD(P)H-hydrate dehydratase [Propionibacteriaceae bacterium]
MAKTPWIDQDELMTAWPRFPNTADKYARGVVGVVTGSQRYPGAGVLSVLGALQAGAGFVRYCGPAKAEAAVLVRAPSVTFGMGQVDAWVVGCGWDTDDMDPHLADWHQILASGAPVVADAGALSLAMDGLPTGSLMTPHAGELARLLGVERAAVEADPVDHAHQAARQFRTTILLKGHSQFVVTPAGKTTTLFSGSPWLAQAGSGDVLAGIAGTLLAQLLDPRLAGLLAAGVQARTSLNVPGPYPPDRMAEFIAEEIGDSVTY